MGKNAAFGRPGARARLRLWWDGMDRTSRVNTLVALGVGAVAVAIVAAGLARDSAKSTGLVNATRPHLTTGSLPGPPATVDLRAAGGEVTPLAAPDPSTTTTSTTVAVALTVPRPAPVPRVTSTTAVPVVATTVPNPQVIYTEVPVPASAPPTTKLVGPTVPASTVPTSSPSATTTVPPTPTTAATLVPPALGLPPLLPIP